MKCSDYPVVKNAVRGAVQKSPRNKDQTLRTNTNLFFFPQCFLGYEVYQKLATRLYPVITHTQCFFCLPVLLCHGTFEFHPHVERVLGIHAWKDNFTFVSPKKKTCSMWGELDNPETYKEMKTHGPLYKVVIMVNIF